MRQALLCVVVAGVALGAGGCGVVSMGPGGVMPSLIYTGVTYPNALNPNMEYQIAFTRADIELKGPVEATSESAAVLGVVSWGDSGYGKLMEAARSKGADGVMNVTVDTEYKSVLGFVYSHAVTKLAGQAYSYKR